MMMMMMMMKCYLRISKGLLGLM